MPEMEQEPGQFSHVLGPMPELGAMAEKYVHKRLEKGTLRAWDAGSTPAQNPSLAQQVPDAKLVSI